jgi:Methyltransferase domain
MVAISRRKILTGPSKGYVALAVCVVMVDLAVRWNRTGDGRPSYLPSAVFENTEPISSANKVIWDQMNPQEQTQAMANVMPYIIEFVKELNATKQDQWWDFKRCTDIDFGKRGGNHHLCDLPPPDCVFISFGISMDFSFDTDLADKWDCRGFAADPTVVHQSQLHKKVTFHNIAASTIKENYNNEGQTTKQEWWTTTVPSLKRFLKLPRISILKMDCESCEYALARDILLEEPMFFHSVDQFTFEVHLNTLWLNDVEQFYYYAMLFKLLHDAGLVLAGSSMGGCGWDRETGEVIDEIRAIGYPGPGRTELYTRRSCHDYLFARIPSG